MIGLFGVLTVVMMNFFTVSSAKFYIASVTPCLAVFIIYLMNIQKLFEVTMDSEQSNQIRALILAAPTAFFATSGAFAVQKTIENGVWEIASNNHAKSEALTEEVVEASKAKDTFVSSLSHEIRNPLNSLKGSIGYLLETISNPDHKKILQNANLSCEIILNIANNVLDAAKLRSDKMEISYLETDFTSIIRKAFSINSEVIKQKNISLKALLDKRLPQMIRVDPSRMLQIMMNLLSNALKFTPQHGKVEVHITWCPSDMSTEDLLNPDDYLYANGFLRPSPIIITNHSSLEVIRAESTQEFNKQELKTRSKNLLSLKQFMNTRLEDVVSLTHPYSSVEPWVLCSYDPPMLLQQQQQQQLSSQKGYLKVQVSDTGCGIAQQNIPKLFQMFTQAHKSVVTMYGGTGLGLWICKQLCQKMGGDIKLYSQIEQGTTFVLYVPVNNDAESQVMRERASRNQDTVRVLVVDDYAHNRDLHKLLVEREGAQVLLAADGQEAFEKFKVHEEGYFSFLMMDVKMSGVDGFTAARMIREWEREQNRRTKVDIYFVSGEYFSEEDILRAFQATGRMIDTTGIGSLKKPIDIETIRTIISRYQGGLQG